MLASKTKLGDSQGKARMALSDIKQFFKWLRFEDFEI